METVGYACLGATVGVLSVIVVVLALILRDLRRTGHMLAAILKHTTGRNLAGNADELVLPLLQAGKKAEAIKTYIECTGVDREEATEHVEALGQQGE